MRVYTIILMLVVTLSACVSSSTIQPQKNIVVHVVLIWLEETGNQEHIQQVIDVSKRLKEIPDIQELQVGKSIPSDRKIVDDSFDVGLYMVFASKEAMYRYLEHPKHQDAVKNNLKPLASKFLVYDFEVSQ